MVERSMGAFRTTSHQDALQWLRQEEEPKLRQCLASHGAWATRLAIRYVTGAHYHTSARMVDFMDYMAERFKTNQVSERTFAIALRRIKPENAKWK